MDLFSGSLLKIIDIAIFLVSKRRYIDIFSKHNMLADIHNIFVYPINVSKQ